MSVRKKAGLPSKQSQRMKGKSIKSTSLIIQGPEKPRQVTRVNFTIFSIRNLSNYSQCDHVYDFKLELEHSLFKVNPENCDGEISICPCSDDNDNVADDEAANGGDVINLNLKLYLELDPTNIDDMSSLMDSPLLITLYKLQKSVPAVEVVPPVTITIKELVDEVQDLKKKTKPKKQTNKKKENNTKSLEIVEKIVEAAVPETTIVKTPIGYAYLDLLQIINDKPVKKLEFVYVYPVEVNANLKTPLITLEITTDKPLHRDNLEYTCNFATITLESIYNLPQFIYSPTIEVAVDLFLITKTGQDMQLERIKLETFTYGKLCKNQPNDIFKKWSHLAHLNCMGLLTKIKVNNTFSGIYNLDNIDLSHITEKSNVFRFNSMCRRLLIGKNCCDLESLMHRLDNHIQVEIRFEDKGQRSADLLNDGNGHFVGTVDLSALLYPDVKTGRFVVPIKRYDRADIMAPPVTQKKADSKRPADLNPKIVLKSLPDLIRSENSIVTLPTNPTGAMRSSRKMSSMQDVETTEQELSETKYCDHSLIESALIGRAMHLILEVSFETPVTEMAVKSIETAPIKMPEMDMNSDEEMPGLGAEIETIEAEFEDEIITILKELPNDLNIGTITEENIWDTEVVDKIPFLSEMRANMVNTIMRLVAIKYNYQRKTSSNENFKNLMSVVYNDLTEMIIVTVNRYFSGVESSLILQDRESKDLHNFIAKEFREFEYRSISNYFYKQLFSDPTNYEEAMINSIINQLEYLEYEKAAEEIKELLQKNPNNAYGLLVNAYIDYINNGLESLYPNLVDITKLCPENVEVWVLLYVLYKNKNYRPGYQHSKMMFEKNAVPKLLWLPYFCSRKELYFEATFDNCTVHDCIYIFLKLGTFKFAQIVYEMLKDHIKDLEKITISSAILLSTKEPEKGLKNLTMFKRNRHNDMLLRLYKGHFLYAMRKEWEAVREYQVIYHSTLSTISNQIANLRCGFWDIEKKNYTAAKTYFSSCSQTVGTFLSWYGFGICLYRTDDLEAAELCFSKATDIYNIFPDIWIYLTMLNLKQKNNEKAISCFETARKYREKNVELWEEMVLCFHNAKVDIPHLF